MRVTVEEIKAKLKDLPDNVRDLVTIDPDDPSLASVTSRTDPNIVYPVHIGVHKDDPGDKSILIATCVCDARVLCWHVVAFYALSKGLLPEYNICDRCNGSGRTYLDGEDGDGDECRACGGLGHIPPEKPSDPQQPPEPVDPEVTVERDTDALTTLTMEAIQADLRAHEARAAMLEEVKRLLEEA